jgi:hypothetical protein
VETSLLAQVYQQVNGAEGLYRLLRGYRTQRKEGREKERNKQTTKEKGTKKQDKNRKKERKI